MSAPVRPVIPAGASVAFVGNRPSEREVAKGITHIGRTQEIINKSCKQAGLPTTVGHHLAYNLFKTGQPTNNEVDSQRDRLLMELKSYKPTVIFALGAAPFYALTRDSKTKVSKISGKPMKSALLEWEHTIFAIPHPASLVYRPQDYREYMQVLTKGAELLQGNGGKVLPPSRYKLIETAEHLNKFYQWISRNDIGTNYLSADIESTGLKFKEDEILCLGLNGGTDLTYIIPDTLLVAHKELVSQIMTVPRIEYIWHNGKFDINFLREAGIDCRVDHDTMLLEYLLDETSKSLSLKKLATRYLGADAYNTAVMAVVRSEELEQTFADVPRPVLYDYLGHDCMYTHEIFKMIYPGVSEDFDLKRAYDLLLIPGTEMLSQVERNGILVSRSRLQKAKKEMSRRKVELLNSLQSKASAYWNPIRYKQDTGAKKLPTVFNPSSSQQMKWFLFEGLRTVIPRGMKANYDTRADTIEAIAPMIERQVPGFATDLLEYKKLRKVLSTYVIGSEKKLRSDGRSNGSYKLSGTATGRLSVDLFQQIPPIARKFYIAPDDRIFVEVDYSGAELRMLAAVSDDPSMKEIFIQGRDLHSEVAAEIYGIRLGVETREQRLVAKTVNFGIMYGRQAQSIAAEFGFSVQEAQSYINRWFARFPVAHRFLMGARAAVRNPGYLVSPFGRKRRFPLVSSQNLGGFENEACNFNMQSGASDCTLLSAIEMNEPLREYDALILNLVHDSILFEFPDDPEVLRAGIKYIQETMSTLPMKMLDTDVKFEVEVKAGYSWGEVTEDRVQKLMAA